MARLEPLEFVKIGGASVASANVVFWKGIAVMLYLREADVDQLLDMPSCLEAVEHAFRQLAAGKANNVPRQRAKAPGIVLHSMSAGAEYLNLVGWKQYTTTRNGAKFHVGLHDQDSGELLALVEADRLGQMRTGAVTGVATKHLAGDAVRLGLFGSGWQAESQLQAVAAALPLEQAFVYSRNAGRRAAFASEMSKRLDIDVTAVDDPRQAVEELPIVITATTSRSPVFEGEWLDTKTLVCAIGSNWLNKAEIDVTTIRRAKRVVCDDVDCCRHEAGDFVPAIDQGAFRWEEARSLGEVLSSADRDCDQEACITVFKSVGMAIEDVAVGAVVIELARKAGIGEAVATNR